MKRLVSILFLILLLASCGQKKSKIEVLKNYDASYFDAHFAQLSVEPTDKTKELNFEGKLESILLDLHKKNPNKKMYYPIGYRLYVRSEEHTSELQSH